MLREGKVRIIGGKWRSRMISFPGEQYLRPTPDRVRETLFNWLGQDLTGQCCLDLFAGSGAMGFEAASRGAAQVVMVELNKNIMRGLQTTREILGATQVELVKMNALTFVATDAKQYDVIFLDPPFQFHGLPQLLNQLATRLTENGFIYVERGNKLEFDAQWQVCRSGRAGKVYYQLMKLDKNG